ncbi:MAG: TIGR01777 family oxidoreductase [Chlamydiia bacterium]|nr:TIGR01777 family oxidoreductase [Chlamydiia bacterium]
MKILIAGSSGLIGSALVSHLKEQGHAVVQLLRHCDTANTTHVLWDPVKGELHPTDLEGFDAMINLCGVNVASGRWTEKRKEAILKSRVVSTELLAHTLLRLEKPPKVLLNASAIGYYGACHQATEDHPAGQGFLSHVCRKWEAATDEAQSKGIRVVNMRFGVVLSPNGGALKKMLTPFRFGLGGRLGPGTQFMSWITLPDVVHAIDHLLHHDALAGPVNLVAPNPVTNSTFTKNLGAVLHRPTPFPVPTFAIHLLFGEMGDELLLESNHILPEKLLQSGYRFLHPDLKGGLEALTERKG